MRTYCVLYTYRKRTLNTDADLVSNIRLYENEICAYSKEHAEQIFYDGNESNLIFVDAFEKAFDGSYFKKCKPYIAKYKDAESKVCTCTIPALSIEHAKLMLCRLMQLYSPCKLVDVKNYEAGVILDGLT